ncbi:MAG: zinc-ribbon domain-containing protein [Deltaproteobacteria bacterium]|nr:zinc-ribbon domain-containing protein [Deltaproteobacteria bacterium]
MPTDGSGLIRVACDSCGAKYSLPRERLRGRVLKIRCKSCDHIFEVRDEVPEPARSSKLADRGQKRWFAVINRDRVGPLTEQEIRDRHGRGEISLRSHIWRQGMSEWTRLFDVSEFDDLKEYEALAIASTKPATPGRGETLQLTKLGNASSATPSVGVVVKVRGAATPVAEDAPDKPPLKNEATRIVAYLPTKEENADDSGVRAVYVRGEGEAEPLSGGGGSLSPQATVEYPDSFRRHVSRGGSAIAPMEALSSEGMEASEFDDDDTTLVAHTLPPEPHAAPQGDFLFSPGDGVDALAASQKDLSDEPAPKENGVAADGDVQVSSESDVDTEILSDTELTRNSLNGFPGENVGTQPEDGGGDHETLALTKPEVPLRLAAQRAEDSVLFTLDNLSAEQQRNLVLGGGDEEPGVSKDVPKEEEPESLSRLAPAPPASEVFAALEHPEKRGGGAFRFLGGLILGAALLAGIFYLVNPKAFMQFLGEGKDTTGGGATARGVTRSELGTPADLGTPDRLILAHLANNSARRDAMAASPVDMSSGAVDSPSSSGAASTVDLIVRPADAKPVVRPKPVDAKPVVRPKPVAEELTGAQIKAGLKAAKAAVKAACKANNPSGFFTVEIHIAGRTGRVTRARLLGTFVDPDLAKCVAAALKAKARFPHFSKTTMTARSPWVL